MPEAEDRHPRVHHRAQVAEMVSKTMGNVRNGHRRSPSALPTFRELATEERHLHADLLAAGFEAPLELMGRVPGESGETRRAVLCE